MRCSRREDSIMYPLITSTPIANPLRKSHIFGARTAALSPITEKAGFSSKVKHSVANKVIVPSDSEEDESKPNFTHQLSTKSTKARSKQKQVQNKQRPSILEELSSDNKKNSRRVSRVNAILDEIVRESLWKSSHDIKVKTDESIDAMYEQVTNPKEAKHRPSEVVKKPSVKNVKTKTPPSRDDSEKENLVRKIITRGHEVDLLLVKKKRKASQVPDAGARLSENTILNNINKPTEKKRKLQQKSEALVKNINPVAVVKPILNEATFPEICTANNFVWHRVSGQEGVFTCNISSGTYIKIQPKCKISQKTSNARPEVLIIIEGNAQVTHADEGKRVGPGSFIRCTADCEILNTGKTKDLIMINLKESC